MTQRELLQKEYTEKALQYIFKNINIFSLYKFASTLPTKTIIDIFDIILRIYVHFQHCF